MFSAKHFPCRADAPLFPQDRKGGVMVFPLRFIKKGTCQINVHTRHPCYRFLCEIQSPRLLRRRVCSCPASRRRRRGGTPRRAQSRNILCGRPHPRKRAAPTRRHTAQSAEPQYFVRQTSPPQTGDVICLRADEPAARFRKYSALTTSALTTKKRDIPSRFLIVLNRCGNYTNSMIAVSEASPRRSPRGMMRV